ncbi:hypothetical protein Rxyl_2702 [Rubrobacter xylanophilus DSM 9941]|uniref:Uncharacterized protein n=1 Tax=Rubrobacter xylanophilus (strain DSM 9941 / JCM 11954 / NBRC 16129 / PRD-1) TaxID=266117 RepID=Q1ASK9_RUBXD|nr:hypothetical protein [Rubrobacter xylanophilus]ABG05619.1 hypothetical protein Rxyl_2702 [Rubrobacter xylanophilus DSM 9941]
MKLLSEIRWVRVLAASLAVHLANVALAALLVIVYALIAPLAQVDPGAGLAEPLAGRATTWPAPVLTFFAAAWAARATSGPAALLSGLLVAAMFGLLYFWPSGPGALAPFALVVAAGCLCGSLRCRARAARDM